MTKLYGLVIAMKLKNELYLRFLYEIKSKMRRYYNCIVDIDKRISSSKWPWAVYIARKTDEGKPERFSK